jgi:hypothetical protein
LALAEHKAYALLVPLRRRRLLTELRRSKVFIGRPNDEQLWEELSGPAAPEFVREINVYAFHQDPCTLPLADVCTNQVNKRASQSLAHQLASARRIPTMKV